MKVSTYHILILLFLALICFRAALSKEPVANKEQSSLVVSLNGKQLEIPRCEIELLERKCRAIIDKHLSPRHSLAPIKLRVEAGAGDVLDLVIRIEPAHGLIWHPNPKNPLGIDGDTSLKWEAAKCERYKVLAVICYLLGVEPSWDRRLVLAPKPS